jgi:hypothetical protein
MLRGNIPRNIEEVVNWQTGLIKHMLDHDLQRVEPLSEFVDDWVGKVNQASAGLLSSQVGSWQTGVNRNVEGRNVPRVLGYNGGAVKYRDMIVTAANDGYQEFSFD